MAMNIDMLSAALNHIRIITFGFDDI